MRRIGLIFQAILLTAAIPVGAAGVEEGISQGPVFPSLKAGLEGTAVADAGVVVGTPIAYESGIAVYHLSAPDAGIEDVALVAMPTDPRLGGDEPAAIPSPDEWDRSPTPSDLTQTETASCRCVINAYRDVSFGVLLLIANVDINNLGDFSGQNDQYTSLSTTCNPAWFFQHKAWGGSFLYVPSSTSIPNLSVYGLNDAISAILHDLP